MHYFMLTEYDSMIFVLVVIDQLTQNMKFGKNPNISEEDAIQMK